MAYYALRWAPDLEARIPCDILNRQLFIWLWEVLFPGESYEMDDAAEYVDIPDISVCVSGYDEKTYKSQ